MNRFLITLVIGSTLGLMQMWIVDASSAQDVRRRAESYNKTSQKLRNLVNAEKQVNRRYLKQRLESWTEKWETGVHRSAVYPGYLGCNPDEVMHAISLIRSKLESDALSCMDNNLAEHEDILNRSVEVAVAAQEIAKLSEETANLKDQHFDALFECMPDPTQYGQDDDIVKYAPPHFRQIARAGSIIITHWKTFLNGFNETRRACVDFHSLQYHGTTADIVYLFEECVRGDISDWIHAESIPSEIDVQVLFKILLRNVYTRPAQLMRTLTGMFDVQAQVSVYAVRKSHCAQAVDLIAHYESRNRTDLTSECSMILPQLKSTYTDLIKEAYKCLIGTFSNFLKYEKQMELDAIDVSRLTTNSHDLIDLQRRNMTMEELGYQLKNKVIPMYDQAREKDDEMLLQFDNDILNIQTHLKEAHKCVQKARKEKEMLSLELSQDYVACPQGESKKKNFVQLVESQNVIDVRQQINKVYDKALVETVRVFQDWKTRLVGRLTVSPNTTPACLSSCAAIASSEMAKIKEACWDQSSHHLKKVRLEMTQNFERAVNLQEFIRNEETGKGVESLKLCKEHAMFLAYPTANLFEIDGKNCGEHFAKLQRDQSENIVREFQECYKSKCSLSATYIAWSWEYESK